MAVIGTTAFSQVLFDKLIQAVRYSFRLKIKSKTLDQRGFVTAAHRRHNFLMKVVMESVVVSMNRAQSVCPRRRQCESAFCLTMTSKTPCLFHKSVRTRAPAQPRTGKP